MKRPLLTMGLILASAAWLAAEERLSTATARAHLEAGAILIDVRTSEEFTANRIATAINIPLGTLEADIGEKVTDKSEVILLHCRRGRRSGIAETELRQLGYTNAFNIGGFEDAERVANAAPKNTP